MCGVFIVDGRAVSAHLNEEDGNVKDSDDRQRDRKQEAREFVLRRARTDQRERVLRSRRRCQGGGSEWLRMRFGVRCEDGLLRVRPVARAASLCRVGSLTYASR